jgi:putative intracellular protease/amidase
MTLFVIFRNSSWKSQIEVLPMSQSNVYLFVFDTMADWEAAFAVAGINNPRFQLSPGRYRVVTVAESLAPVTTMGGIRVQPDVTLAEVNPRRSAMLILPGGEAWELGANAAAIEKACAFIIAGVPVAAICAATFALARTGILDDFHHTSNAREYLAASGYRGGSFYCDAPAVTDENLITASGLAPVDFAYEIFKTLNLYTEAALLKSYALFKFGRASSYYELARLAS